MSLSQKVERLISEGIGRDPERNLSFYNPEKNMVGYFATNGRLKHTKTATIPAQDRMEVDELDLTPDDSRYGFSVFDVSETELGEDHKGTLGGVVLPEEFFLMHALSEEVGVPIRISEKGILRRFGMRLTRVNDLNYEKAQSENFSKYCGIAL